MGMALLKRVVEEPLLNPFEREDGELFMPVIVFYVQAGEQLYSIFLPVPLSVMKNKQITDRHADFYADKVCKAIEREAHKEELDVPDLSVLREVIRLKAPFLIKQGIELRDFEWQTD